MASIKHIFVSGALSGFALGFFLKFIEASTGKKVYTLLLNVDFIPFFNRIIWPQWIEFFFHLIISFMIAAGFFILLLHFNRPYITALIVTSPAVMLYFPLSLLAIKPVAGVNDVLAFLYWTAGHLLYAFVLGLYGQKEKRKA
jgi:hypothetical protein